MMPYSSKDRMVYAWTASQVCLRCGHEPYFTGIGSGNAVLYHDRDLGYTTTACASSLQGWQGYPCGGARQTSREDGHSHHGRRTLHPACSAAHRLAKCRNTDWSECDWSFDPGAADRDGWVCNAWRAG